MRARSIVVIALTLLLTGALPASAQMTAAGGGAGGDMMGAVASLAPGAAGV